VHSRRIREISQPPSGQLRLRPGRLVVLEGLDGAGKTTQSRELKALFGTPPVPLFTHQPSGAGILGEMVHRFSNENPGLVPLAMQLLHLASHAQHYETEILPALDRSAVVMDRCWWSTVAYGYFGGGLADVMPPEDFERLARLPARGREPDMVFVLPAANPLDSENVLAGYDWLRARHSSTSVAVPLLPIEKTTQFIVRVLLETQLAKQGPLL
jgi:dTMP kinase